MLEVVFVVVNWVFEYGCLVVEVGFDNIKVFIKFFL